MSHCFKIAEMFRAADQWTRKCSVLISYEVSTFSKAYVCLILLIIKILRKFVNIVSACHACEIPVIYHQIQQTYWYL